MTRMKITLQPILRIHPTLPHHCSGKARREPVVRPRVVTRPRDIGVAWHNFGRILKRILSGMTFPTKLGIGLWLYVAGSGMATGATYSVINTNDSGAGSLRQAILDANSNPGFNSIQFQIPGTGPFTLNPQSTYPPITQPVVIDGTSQAGYGGVPLIQINGAGIGANGDGLNIAGGGSTISGLAIFRCKRDGIRITGLGNSTIQGCYLGTDASGTNALGNQEAGVYIYRSSTNLIGGTTPAQRNVISANSHGVYIDDGNPPPTGSGNQVAGNYIGTTATGTAILGNTNNGVYIIQAPGNFIGGTSPGAGNLISGNYLSGVYLSGASAYSNVIAGNLIGTDVNGTTSLSNRLDGITIYGAGTNLIGGTAAGARNIISGNNARGILIINAGAVNASANVIQGNYIGTDINGQAALPNRTNGVVISAVPGNFIGGTNAGAGNVIAGNLQNGILIILSGANSNGIQGNYIGTDRTGTNALPNSFSGITLNAATGTLVGGTNAGSGNLISGNAQNGIFLETASGGADLVQGNLIGTDRYGRTALSNSFSGIWIESTGNQIGGPVAAARNVISGNGNHGVYLNGNGASNNVIQGNYIGTDASGTKAVGNGMNGLYSGIYLNSAGGNRLGGTQAGTGNVISGNGDKGISLNGAGSTNNWMQGNIIGADTGGTQGLPNANGGIYIYNGANNTIGGTNAGAGNLISGNNADGIYISAANNTIIQGNYIGTQADGVSPLGNLWHNIEFLNNSSQGLVGGMAAAADNRIAYTRTAQYDGVRIRTGSIGNRIWRNSIFANGAGSVNGLGICVGAVGVTTNGLPVLTSVTSGTTAGLLVRGTLTNTPRTTFQLQLYANPTPNISGYGEGYLWLGTTNITTDATGVANFRWAMNTNVPAGQYLAATVTDATNNTSEFSADMLVPPAAFSLMASNYLAYISTNYESELVTNPITGEITTNPPVAVVVNNYANDYYLTWPTNPAGLAVMQTTSLTATATWQPVTNAPTLYSNLFQIALPLSTEGNGYFRLQIN